MINSISFPFKMCPPILQFSFGRTKASRHRDLLASQVSLPKRSASFRRRGPAPGADGRLYRMCPRCKFPLFESVKRLNSAR